MSRRRLLPGLLAMLVIYPALVFGAAGTLAWPMAWAYIVLAIVGGIAARVVVQKRHPDTVAERSRGLDVPGMKEWDRRLVRVVVIGPVVVVLVAALDHRFGATTFAPWSVQVGALGLAAAGYLLAGYAMAQNRFFSAVARIQTDRGHTVVDTGPYRWIRHPGYAGSVLATALLPVILDSLWAVLPALITVAALVVRTRLEDRMLLDELPGYPTYALATRYRLIPGIW
jgi:protein-S-isoprenylcysteine O-methyltransferase Ste14